MLQKALLMPVLPGILPYLLSAVIMTTFPGGNLEYFSLYGIHKLFRD